jgi:phosphoserine aminotransferase
MRTVPNRPFFSSGPCAKPHEWRLNDLESFLSGRSHRSSEAVDLIQGVSNRLKNLLGIPDSYSVGLVPGSATGAMEIALWNLLGPRTVDVFWWDVFSGLWAHDISQELKIPHRIFTDFPPDVLSHYNPAHDLVFAWCGTTHGLWAGQDHSWIPSQREGLIMCDITSAVMTTALPWEALDVIACSWQKGLGGEASTGILVLSPRAMQRLEETTPPWPIPRLLRLKNNGTILQGLFSRGESLNTLSLLCIQEASYLIELWEKRGGLSQAIDKCHHNYTLVEAWCQQQEWVDFLVTDPMYRAHGPVCLRITDSQFQELSTSEQWIFLKLMDTFLRENKAGFDCLNHAQCRVPSLRIWCGPTVDAKDLSALLPWLSQAFFHAKEIYFSLKSSYS